MTRLRIDLTEQEALELLRALDRRVHWACEWLEERPQDPGPVRIIEALLRVEKSLKEAFPDLKL